MNCFTTPVLLALCFAITLCCSCEKDGDEDTSTDWTGTGHSYEVYYSSISPDNQGHMFQTGTYWIYRNDSTGVEDSVFVDATQYYEDVNEGCHYGQDVTHHEMFAMRIRSTATDSVFTMALHRGTVAIWFQDQFDELNGQCSYFCWPPYSLQDVWHYGAGLDTAMVIHGESFNALQWSESPANANISLYFEKHVGIAAWDSHYWFATDWSTWTYDDDPWTLVRWHIEL